MHSAIPLNIADIVAAVIVLISAVVGFRRGLIGQVIPLIAVLAVGLALWFGYTPCFNWLTRISNWDKAFVWLVSLMLLILVPLAFVMLLGRRLQAVAKLPVLATFDRIGGAVTGLAGGALLVILAFLALAGLPDRYRPNAFGNGSWTGRQVQSIQQQVVGIVTQQLGQTQNVLINAREQKSTRQTWER